MLKVTSGIRSFKGPVSQPPASRLAINKAQGIVKQTLATGHTINHPSAQGAVRTLETNGYKVV